MIYTCIQQQSDFLLAGNIYQTQHAHFGLELDEDKGRNYLTSEGTKLKKMDEDEGRSMG